MKYIKYFYEHDDYTSYIANTTFLPNLSYCEDLDHVHFNKLTFNKQYFTTIARENGTISFNIWKSMNTDVITSISYSTDNGATWTTTANQNDKEEHLSINVNVQEGDKILWKGTALYLGYFDADDYVGYVGSFFSSDCEFDAKGNVMSLIYGDNFVGEVGIEYGGQFACLFYDYDEELSCMVVNAKDLSLPATTLTSNCYESMFSGCTSLTTAPELPATTLANTCYRDMFRNCQLLTTAPELPATTLVDYCYYIMFNGCKSLNYIKAMFTTTPNNTYTGSWVQNVSSTGTFVKNSAATWNVTGKNGVPSKWTVLTASE